MFWKVLPLDSAIKEADLTDFIPEQLWNFYSMENVKLVFHNPESRIKNREFGESCFLFKGIIIWIDDCTSSDLCFAPAE